MRYLQDTETGIKKQISGTVLLEEKLMVQTENAQIDPKSPNLFLFDSTKEGAGHPERENGEIFFTYGNSFTFGIALARFATRRRGSKVIDDLGKDRTADARGEFFPIFVKESEYEQLKGQALR
jgi:hypothetical protein